MLNVLNAKQKKAFRIKEIFNFLNKANGLILTECQSLTVEQFKKIRKNLKKDAQYLLCKNSLTKKAIKNTTFKDLKKYLFGSNAIAFINGDIAKVSNSLCLFSKLHKDLIIKVGFFKGRIINFKNIINIASLKSKLYQLSRLAMLCNLLIVKVFFMIKTIQKEKIKQDINLINKPEQGNIKMTKINSEKLIETFKNLTVLELSEFIKLFEKTFHVKSDLTNMNSNTNGSNKSKDDIKKEKTKKSFNVVLESIGSKKIQVIKEVRSLTSLGLKDSKDLVDSAPSLVLKGVNKEEANKAKEKLEKAGAIVNLK